MNIGDIIYLDLNTVDLYGWEDNKSDLVIDSIISGIEKGDQFPEVFVIWIDEKTYCLDWRFDRQDTDEYADGGHNRAVGHYIANAALRSKITRIISPLEFRIRKKENPNNYFNVKDIKLVDDHGEYESRKKIDKKYR